MSQGLSAQQAAGVIVAGASFIQPTLVKIAVEQLRMEETQELRSQTSALVLWGSHGWGAELARGAFRPWREENWEKNRERFEPLVSVGLSFQCGCFGCGKKQTALNL